MTLPKSLRERHRYLFFRLETVPGAVVEENAIQRAVWFEAQNLYGDAVSAKTGGSLIEYSGTGKGEKFGIGIFRCSHGSVREARSALACMHEVDGEPVGAYVLGVSGTLKSGRRKYFDEMDKEPERVRIDGEVGWYVDGVVDVEGDDDGFMYATPQDYGKDK